ncbi:VCBS repeat-containing protein [candidate division TA06 bacterium]|nr:VCBS repeat-containing protein [candidate division TA06 bacterium]
MAFGFFTASDAAVISFTQTTMVSDLSSDPVTIGKSSYHRLAVKGSFPLEAQPGSPLLPVKLVNILVPFNASVGGLKMSGSSSENLPGSFNPFPVQKPVPMNGQAAPDFVAADPAFYQAKGDYPGQLARIKGVSAWGEHQVVTVEVMPLQYNPSKAQLTLYNSISFEIEYALKAGSASPVKRRSPMAQSLVMNQLQTAIANKNDIVRLIMCAKITVDQTSAKSPATESPSLEGRPVDYVIITSEELAPQFQRLADWKTQKGINTIIKTTRWIESNYRGADIQEKIRHFIQDAWVNWGTVLVLLGGDTPVIPARYVPWRSWPQYIPDLRIPTDLYYSDIVDTSCTGDIQSYNFDPNRDGQYGDVLGGEVLDMQPDLLLGRAPVSTTAQAQTFVDKVLAYERNPPPGFGSSFLMVSEGSYAWSSESVNNFPLKTDAPWIDSYELYRPAVDSACFQWAGDKNLDAGSAMVELNKGYNIVYHFDHGGIYQLGTGATTGGGWLYRSDAGRLANNGRPSVVITPACDPNAFDHDCFAKHLLNNPNGGAVAFIGNSRVGWGYQGYLYQAMFTGIYYYRQQMLGQAFSVLQHIRDSYSQFSINLMGDPSMLLWTGEPQKVCVNHPGQLTVSDSLIKVDISGPAAGGTVELAVYKQNEALKVIQVTIPSSVSLPISLLTEGPLLLTVTGTNVIPSQTSCQIVPSGAAHPFVSSYTVRDDGRTIGDKSNGNCDRVMNPGETIALYPSLTNNGLSPLENAFVILRSADPQVKITDSIISLPVLEPGQTLVCDTLMGPRFLLTVSPRIKSDRTLGLTAVFIAKADLAVSNNKTEKIIVSQEIKTGIQADSLVISSYVLSPAASLNAAKRETFVTLDSVVIANLGTGQARGITLTATAVAGGQTGPRPEMLRFGSIPAGGSSTHRRLALKPIRTDDRNPLALLLTIRDSYGRESRQIISRSEVINPVCGIQARALGSDRIQIIWALINDGIGIKGYNIYRKTTDQVSFTKVNLVPVMDSRTFTDQGLIANTSYSYAVSAVDSLGSESPAFPASNTIKTQPALMPGFPAAVGNGTRGSRMWSSPASGDINNDGFEEIIIGSDDGKVYAFDRLGKIVPGWPVVIGGSIDQSSPALADIDSDGFLEVVMGSGGWYTVPGDGQVHVLRHDGSEQPGWPQAVCGDAFSGAAVTDLNCDGSFEIVAATTAGYVYAWDAGGSLLLGWPICTGGPVWSSPVLGHLDGDPQMEIAVTANSAGALKLLVLNHDGTSLPGWPIIVQSSAGYGLASPVFADMDNDGKNEIILGAETYCPTASTKGYCFKANGEQLAGWPVGFGCGTRIVCSPAIADLDGDGKLDAAFIASNGVLRAYSDQGVNRMLWEVQTGSNGRTNPIAADIDSDGIIEVLLTTESGYLYAFEGSDGSLTPGYPIWIEPSWSAPALSDINQDGKMELLAFGWGSHKLFAWELGCNTKSAGSCGSTFRGNMRRTGCGSDTLTAKLSGALQTELTDIPVFATKLSQNFPNPVKEQTTICYQISQPGWIKINIYNVTGQLVKTLVNEDKIPGSYQIKWDGKNEQGKGISSGTYLYRLESSGFNATKRMLVLK